MTVLTQQEIEEQIKLLELKIGEVALNGGKVSLKEGDSELTTETTLADVLNSLALYKKMLEELINPVPVGTAPKKRATRKKKADFE